jgi:hypothetical protein
MHSAAPARAFGQQAFEHARDALEFGVDGTAQHRDRDRYPAGASKEYRESSARKIQLRRGYSRR